MQQYGLPAPSGLDAAKGKLLSRAGHSEKRSVSLALAFIAFHARAALAEPSASGTGETIRRKFYSARFFS